MVWIAALGLVLQITGLVIASSGISQTYNAMFGRVLWRDLAADLIGWWRRVILRRPQGQSIEVEPATISVEAASLEITRGRRPPPEEPATTEDRVRWLDEVTADIYEDLTSVRAAARTTATEVEQRLASEFAAVDSRAARVAKGLEVVRVAVAGSDGAGLRRAVLGLLVTLFGVALTAFGLPW